MKKNLFLTIILNILLIIVLIFVLDFLFVYYKNNSHIIKNGFRLLPESEALKIEKARDTVSGPANVNPQQGKRPVVFSGCSIAYGLFLPFEETIGYLVSQKTGRKAYNRGRSSTCISHVLYELTNSKVYDEMEQPEYMFFIYDPFLHAMRTNTFVYSATSQTEYLFYRLKDGRLNVGHAIPFLSSFSLFRHICFEINHNNPFTEYNKALTVKIFEEVNNKIHKIFPDIHFIVIVYEGNFNDIDYHNPFFKDILKALEDKGIEVISVSQMLGDNPNQEKYKADPAHPSAYVWEKVSEKLAEKYNL